MGLRPSVKRGRDADRLLTAIVSTGNGASFADYLLGVLNTAQAMRDTQNTEARRPISRTYEGVQWFKHEHGWRAAIPGSPLSVNRFTDMVFTRGHFLTVEIWDTTFGGHWTTIGTSPPLSVTRGGSDFFNRWDMIYGELPWIRQHTVSVGQASKLVQQIRDTVKRQVVA